nr:MarR family transcriptional regulator [Motilibacter deserti]
MARQLDLARRDAFADAALEAWEFDVLAALRRAGAPHSMSPGQLAHETLVGSGTMTNRVDRLEAKGLVRRAPNPRDGRGVLVVLTPQGAARSEAALTALLARERVVLAALDDPEQQQLAQLLRRLLLPLDGSGRVFEPGVGHPATG